MRRSGLRLQGVGRRGRRSGTTVSEAADGSDRQRLQQRLAHRPPRGDAWCHTSREPGRQATRQALAPAPHGAAVQRRRRRRRTARAGWRRAAGGRPSSGHLRAAGLRRRTRRRRRAPRATAGAHSAAVGGKSRTATRAASSRLRRARQRRPPRRRSVRGRRSDDEHERQHGQFGQQPRRLGEVVVGLPHPLRAGSAEGPEDDGRPRCRSAAMTVPPTASDGADQLQVLEQHVAVVPARIHRPCAAGPRACPGSRARARDSGGCGPVSQRACQGAGTKTFCGRTRSAASSIPTTARSAPSS